MCIQSFDVPTRSRLRGVLRVLSALVFVAAALLGAWSAHAGSVEDRGRTQRVRPNQSIDIVVGLDAIGHPTTPFAVHRIRSGPVPR